VSAWDTGVTWFSRRTVAPTELPMTVDYVTAQVLRVANGTADDVFVEACVTAAVDACEKDTGRALMPQTLELILSRFPYGSCPIVLPRLPLISVDSLYYTDENGDTIEMDVSSPASIEVIPSGEFRRARIAPIYDATWPDTRCQQQAVTVTFTCGYADADSVPEILKTGIGVMVAELYKQRTLSVHAVHNTPSVLQLNRFWRKVEG
jgi:uncharacterized phiE125 gp8 family phage protein